MSSDNTHTHMHFRNEGEEKMSKWEEKEEENNILVFPAVKLNQNGAKNFLSSQTRPDMKLVPAIASGSVDCQSIKKQKQKQKKVFVIYQQQIRERIFWLQLFLPSPFGQFDSAANRFSCKKNHQQWERKGGREGKKLQLTTFCSSDKTQSENPKNIKTRKKGKICLWVN